MLRLPEVEARVGLSKATIYRMIKKGEFPAPARMGGASRWLDTTIDAYLLAVTSAGRASPPKPASS
jgi:prophage regulatory protein